MVVLKKVKASSLTEVLVATTIIVLVFGIAVITINNVLQNSVHQNTHRIQTEITELQYFYKNKQLKTPFEDEIDSWKVTIQKDNSDKSIIIFEATHQLSKKKLIKKITTLEVK